jgi:putative glutamine amidotransferase
LQQQRLGIGVLNAPGLAVGVQWHPEYDMETDAISRRIFMSFGDAVSLYCRRQKPVLCYGT